MIWIFAAPRLAAADLRRNPEMLEAAYLGDAAARATRTQVDNNTMNRIRTLMPANADNYTFQSVSQQTRASPRCAEQSGVPAMGYGMTVPFDEVTLAQHREWYGELLGYTELRSRRSHRVEAFTQRALAGA